MEGGAPHSKTHISRGLAWIGLASTLVGMLDFGATVILLHLFITPEEYGIASLAAAFFPVLDHATDMGLSSAVIQRDDHSPEKISTVFWLNLLMSLLLFGLLAVAAPIYARWMGHAVVGGLLLAYGGKLIFQNAYFIPYAMMKRDLRFKELSLLRIVANSGEFLAKIGFAALGLRIWCFVLGPLTRILITGVGTQLMRPWRPRLVFHWREGREYLRFGLRTSASQILFYFYTNVDYAVVNKLFGATALGLFRAAYELVLEPVRIIAQVFIDIAFPTFSRLRQKRAQLIEQFIAFTRQNLVVVVPYVAVVFVVARDALAVAWGPDFAPAADAARILCFVGVLRGLSYVVPPLLDGMGYPGLTLGYTALAAVLLPALYVVFGLWLGPTMGYDSVAVSWAVGYPLAFTVLLIVALRRLGLAPLVYLRRVIGVPLCAAASMLVGLGVHRLTQGMSAAPRFASVAAVMVLVLGVLLAYFQGISPRTVMAAIRAPGPSEPS